MQFHLVPLQRTHPLLDARCEAHQDAGVPSKRTVESVKTATTIHNAAAHARIEIKRDIPDAGKGMKINCVAAAA